MAAASATAQRGVDAVLAGNREVAGPLHLVRRPLGLVVDGQRLLEQHLAVLQRRVGVRLVPRDQLAHRPDRRTLGQRGQVGVEVAGELV